MNIETLKQTVNILDVVESYAPLKKSGGQYLALENPLRDEKTPSLRIYEDTQSWYDFGSGEGGDIIDFIKAAEDIDTKMAINFLQEKFAGDFKKDIRLRTPKVDRPVLKKDNEILRLSLKREQNNILMHHVQSIHQTMM
jgi:DNA primase